MEDPNIVRLRVELDLRKRDYEEGLSEILRVWEVEGPKDDWEKEKLEGLVYGAVAILSKTSRALIGAYDGYVEALENLIPDVKLE